MDVMSFQSRRSGRSGMPTADRLTTVAGVILAILLVLASLPGLAAAGGGAGPAKLPAPVPVPARASMLVADFPEVANPWRGCLAVVNVSAATDAPGSGTAGAITGPLFQDACFGG